MHKGTIFILVFFALLVLLAAGTIWLAHAPIKPASQQTHMALPDERISR